MGRDPALPAGGGICYHTHPAYRSRRNIMRVALLSYNARAHDAVGNHVAETAAFFLERGSALRVFVQSAERLHPALRGCTQPVDDIAPDGPVWDYLAGADLVIAQYAQAYELLHFLPLLAGGKPRLLLGYHSVTP